MRLPRARIALIAALVASGVLAPAAIAQEPGALQRIPGDGGKVQSAGIPFMSPDGRHIYTDFGARITTIALDTATGAMAPVVGPAGCYGEALDRECANVRLLNQPEAIAFSPDGRQAYVTAKDAILILDRDPVTGTLTQKPGTAGCIDRIGAEGCQGGARMLVGPSAIAVHPSGTHVYVAATGVGGKAILTFTRDPVTGTLAQAVGAAYIHSSACQPGVACTVNPNVSRISDLAFDAAGDRLYAVDVAKNALLGFDVGSAPAGGLTMTQCLRTGVYAGCSSARALYGVAEVEATADGRSLYTHSPSNEAIGVFALAGESRMIVQLAGQSGCVGKDSAANRADQCAVLDLIDTSSEGLATSPDGASVYLGGWQLAILTRNRTLGTLSGLPKPAGCINKGGSFGCTADGAVDAPTEVVVSPDNRFVYLRSYDNDTMTAYSRTLPPDLPSAAADDAAAVPKAERVRWIRRGRVVRARFLAATGVTYRLTATRRGRTRGVPCTTRTRMNELRGTCVIRRLTAGRWRFALTPTLNDVKGDPSRKTLRIRARR